MNPVFRLSLANALVQHLWFLGLITDEEKAKITEKNEVSFLS